MAGEENGLPDELLIHTATPVSYSEDAAAGWVEGEPGRAPEPTAGVSFPCVLFLPGPGGAQTDAYRVKVVSAPTLLFNPLRSDGTLVQLSGENELVVDAPDLESVIGQLRSRWLLDGEPQPFGPPGVVIGLQASLRAVVD